MRRFELERTLIYDESDPLSIFMTKEIRPLNEDLTIYQNIWTVDS